MAGTPPSKVSPYKNFELQKNEKVVIARAPVNSIHEGPSTVFMGIFTQPGEYKINFVHGEPGFGARLPTNTTSRYSKNAYFDYKITLIGQCKVVSSRRGIIEATFVFFINI